MTQKNNESSTENSKENTVKVHSPSTGNKQVAKRKGTSSADGSSVAKNKGGRPKGSKNSMTLLQAAMTENTYEQVAKEWTKIVNTTIKRANEGDSTALKILWDRFIPAKKATDGKDNVSSGGIQIIVQGSAQVNESKKEDIIDGEIIEDEVS